MDEAAPFTVNATTYSGLGEFLAEQREKYGLRFVVNLSPALPSTLPEYEPFRRGSQHKAFVTYSSIITLEGQSLPPVKFDTHNVVFGILWPCSPVAYVDFFKNTTISWWTKELAYMHKTLPFDGIWLDMNEPSEFSANRAAISAERRKNCFKGWKMTCQATIYDDPPYPTKAATQYGPEARLSDRTLCMTGRFGGHKGYWHYDVHNLYGLSQARATHIALEELLPERKLIISRSTYPSSGRYGGHWLGDNQSSWGHLYRSIIGMLEFNMFGIPYVGADICGFFGDTTEDLCVRWMQLGAFYPFCRSHNDMSAMAQDPAVFSQEAQAVMRKALHTRYTLLPFLYTLFFNAHINGTPVVRPLFFEFPHDSHTYGIRTQFMWGSSLLISPITKNRTYMSFYIPAGLWYNYYQNTPFLSSGEYMVHNWLTLQTSTPLYVKAGSILPTQRYYNHSMKPEDRMCQPLSLVVYADNAGNSVGTLFWDDGVGKHNIANETYDYFRFTTVDCHLTLWRLHKSTRPVPFVIQSVVLVGQKKPPLRMYVDGRKKSNAISQMADKTYELNVQLSLHLDSKDHTIEWTS
ncbi:lysosomal alpha-glucosidase-like [Haemaphysalis longicornis]